MASTNSTSSAARCSRSSRRKRSRTASRKSTARSTARTTSTALIAPPSAQPRPVGAPPPPPSGAPVARSAGVRALVSRGVVRGLGSRGVVRGLSGSDSPMIRRGVAACRRRRAGPPTAEGLPNQTPPNKPHALPP
eukprot:1064459-Prymnesium_polylepis.1